MARGPQKKGPKPIQASTGVSQPSSSSALPKAFEHANPNFAQLFLSGLPRENIYLVHIDTTSPEVKRRTYLAPVYINLFIVAVLGVRLYYAAPAYFEVITGIYGFDYTSREYKLDLQSALGTTASRFMLFMADYALFSLLGSWPWEFMFGNKYNGFKGPFAWRREAGFQDREVVVRRSKTLHRGLMSTWNLDNEMDLRFAILPAMDAKQLEKTGYLLIDKAWDLDFRAMIKAHGLLESKSLHFSDFEAAAYAFYQGKWITWRFPKADVSAAEKDDSPKMKAFREKMLALNCEDVFYRWIEIIQFESSVPGGLTEGGKGRALRELRALLDKKGVDASNVFDELGGSKNLPGMEDD